MNNPSQYLLDFLSEIEARNDRRRQIILSKKYLIYYDGQLVTGTNDFKDVERWVSSTYLVSKYTYITNN